MVETDMMWDTEVFVMDRGDAPAQAVLDKNARSKARRIADETKEELAEVMGRVDRIYGNFELSAALSENSANNMEYLNNMAELEELIRDQVKKRKYQQQVTIFIVGFENVSGQKLRLLQQVNEFFMENSQPELDMMDDRSNSPDLDLDAMASTVEDTLQTTEDLATRLGDLNTEMMECQTKVGSKGKKKLEKALSHAKDDIQSLNTKLLALQQDIEEKENKAKQLLKQLEMKNIEIQRYRAAAEVAKRNNEDIGQLKEEISSRDAKVAALTKQIELLEQDMALTHHTKEKSQERLLNAKEESNAKIKQLEEALQHEKLLADEARRDLARLHDKQLEDLKNEHRMELEQLQQQHSEEVKNLLGDEQSNTSSQFEDAPRIYDFDSEQHSIADTEQHSIADERDVATQVLEDAFSLTDEDSWTTVPEEALKERFGQYRQLARKEIQTLQENLHAGEKDTSKKVNTLKSQFQEYKSKWEAERQSLLLQLEKESTMQEAVKQDAIEAQANLKKIQSEREKPSAEQGRTEEIRETIDNATQTDVMSDMDEIVQRELLDQTDDAKALKNQGTSGYSASGGSRASSHHSSHREALDSVQAAQDERFTLSRSPTSHSLNKSVLSDAELNEDGDMPFTKERTVSSREDRSFQSQEAGTPISQYDKSTSPMTPKSESAHSRSQHAFRDGIAVAEHPVVEQYIKTYETVIDFKEALARNFVDREMMSKGYLLSDLETITFDKNSTVLPQLEMMTTNVQKILRDIENIVRGVLPTDREYPVSSLNLSREETRLTRCTPDSAYMEKVENARSAPHSASSSNLKAQHQQQQLEELQQKCSVLEKKLSSEAQKHEHELRHEAMVMIEMQDTINALRKEINEIRAARLQEAPPPPQVQIHGPSDIPIMFTRLDSERNAKVMKRALNERRLSQDSYESAVKSMDEYVSLPAKRLVHLVTKYVHHVQMKQIEERVHKSQALDQEVYQTLDRMEELQATRAHRWANQMDALGEERLRLASILMDTLGSIERESGIFLIKPAYSYKSQSAQNRYTGKLSRKLRNSRESPTLQLQDEFLLQRGRDNPLGTGMQVGPKHLEGNYQYPVWQPSAAEACLYENQVPLSAHLNTPKMLELDINRMLIKQNQIMVQSHPEPRNADRLASLPHQAIRTNVAVTRMSSAPSPTKTSRSNGFSSGPRMPPTSPNSQSLPMSARTVSAGARLPKPENSLLPPISSTTKPLNKDGDGPGIAVYIRVPPNSVA